MSFDPAARDGALTDGDCSDSFLTALLLPWAGSGRILAAVSGGPDSMALLHMLARWGKLVGVTILAASVDHGLRPQGAVEAAAVKHFASGLGIDHVTLVWEHGGVNTGLQERARAARYALLAGHATAIGAGLLMTGHHGDDQAETMLFRLVRGSGLHGLAGMAAERRDGQLTIARPLLSLSKHALIDYCKQHRIAYFDDPSNTHPQFARSRMRSLLPALQKEGLGVEEWARLARRLRRADDALATLAAAMALKMVNGTVETGLQLDFAELNAGPEEITLRVLIDLVGQFDPGNPVRLERAENLLCKLQGASDSGGKLGATLGQARISLSPDRKLTIMRQRKRNRGL